MELIVGTAPDSWGVWFPDDPRQTPWHRFMDEAAEAGYRWIELGPFGYLPTEPEALEAELARRRLSVAAGFVMFALEDPGAWSVRRQEADEVCGLLRRLGARFLVLIDDSYTDLFSGEQTAPENLDDAAWRRLIATTREVADVAEEHGLQVVFHPHAQTHIEREDQIERFLTDVDPRVGLCFDVGHHAYAGGDPVEFLRRHHPRIPYLHLKSVDGERRRTVEAEGIPFAKAVAQGVFVEPSAGMVDFLALRDVLQEIDYRGFGIVEQDMYPAPFDKPLPIAKLTRAYLQEIGLG